MWLSSARSSSSFYCWPAFAPCSRVSVCDAGISGRRRSEKHGGGKRRRPAKRVEAGENSPSRTHATAPAASDALEEPAAEIRNARAARLRGSARYRNDDRTLSLGNHFHPLRVWVHPAQDSTVRVTLLLVDAGRTIFESGRGRHGLGLAPVGWLRRLHELPRHRLSVRFDDRMLSARLAVLVTPQGFCVRHGPVA